MYYNISEDMQPRTNKILEYQYKNNCTKKIYIQRDTKYCLICEESTVTIHIELTKEHIDVDIYVLCLGKEKSTTTCTITCTHTASYTQSNTHIYTFCKNKNNIHAEGDIQILPTTQKTIWHLVQENLLLDEKVHVKACPMLHVHTSDTHTSHGTKTHRLDPVKKIYLQSKWIDEHTTQRLLIQGYIQKSLEPHKTKNKKEITELEELLLQKIVG